MSMKSHFELLAKYNQWMNSNIYEAARGLTEQDLAKGRGAFFGSILGTLNHLIVADTIWLKRFAAHSSSTHSLSAIATLEMPSSLDQTIFSDFNQLLERRVWLDQLIIDWIATLSDHDLESTLSYCNTKGTAFNKRYWNVILHFFNHQTHHRGQASTLLSQAGADIGVTDLLAIIPNE